jgi:hypothetical protein
MQYLALKPNAEEKQETLNLRQSETEDFESWAERLVDLGNDLLTMQATFNAQLLEAARNKISIRDNVDTCKRLSEIHKLLKEEGDPGFVVGYQVRFLPGEYTTRSVLDRSSEFENAKKLYSRGTIHDSDFLLYSEVDLSTHAQQAKANARESLRIEGKHLVEATRAEIDHFNNSLRGLRKLQLETTLQLKLRGSYLDLQAKQLEVILNYDSKAKKLLNAELDEKERESQLQTAISIRENELKSIKCLVPVHINDIELSKVLEKDPIPMLVSQSMLDELNCTATELESTQKNIKSQILDIRKQCKHSNTTIGKLKSDLEHYQNQCKEIQMQKFGKLLDGKFNFSTGCADSSFDFLLMLYHTSFSPASILDINPVATNNHSKEVDAIQQELDSIHRQAVENARKDKSRLQAQLLSTTNENTKLLREIASLREQHLKIDEDMKRATASNSYNKSTMSNDKAEYEKFCALSAAQKQEIEMLLLKIQALKSKCGHVAVNHELGHL